MDLFPVYRKLKTASGEWVEGLPLTVGGKHVFVVLRFCIGDRSLYQIHDYHTGAYIGEGPTIPEAIEDTRRRLTLPNIQFALRKWRRVNE